MRERIISFVLGTLAYFAGDIQLSAQNDLWRKYR